MTLNEFNAWLDGYTAKMGDAPTPDEWATIKAKLATVRAFEPPPPALGVRVWNGDGPIPPAHSWGWGLPPRVTSIGGADRDVVKGD